LSYKQQQNANIIVTEVPLVLVNFTRIVRTAFSDKRHLKESFQNNWLYDRKMKRA
jgi:hypothetical protein